jgi:hypothetical protein
MELWFNLLWLIAAAVTFALRVESRWFQRNCAAKRAHSFIGHSLFLVLLFPVISVSDDLQAVRGSVDESAPAKNQKRVVSDEDSSGSSGKAQTPDGTTPRPLHDARQLVLFGLVQAAGVALLNRASQSDFSSRAPPSLIPAV